MNRVGLMEAVRLLKRGQVVAIPTDTAYGLAADASNSSAIAKVKQLKGRARTKPIALIAADLKQVRRFFRLSPAERLLAKRYWPGPLTIVLGPKQGRLATRSLSSSGRIGVRVPACAVARQLARKLDAPITATSANRSGTRECYTVVAVRRSLPTLSAIVDGGKLPRHHMSTVIVLHGHIILTVRPGPIVPSLD